MSTELRTPCGEGDSEDWFIRADGRQYAHDPVLSDEQIAAIHDEPEHGEPGTEEWEESVQRAIGRAEVDARTAALQRRRHAKEACFTSCLYRLECLTAALDNHEVHGTWGGYYEEELLRIRRQRDAGRARARTAPQ